MPKFVRVKYAVNRFHCVNNARVSIFEPCSLRNRVCSSITRSKIASLSLHSTFADSPEWQKAITFYVDLMHRDGPPGASENTVQDCLTLFARGDAAIWVDATSLAPTLFDKSQSQVADKVAFAPAAIAVTPKLWKPFFRLGRLYAE